MFKHTLLIIPCLFQIAFAQLQPYTAQNGKKGYVDSKTNNVVIPAFYLQAKEFNGDYAAVKTPHNWQIIDKTGKVFSNLLQGEIMNGSKENQFTFLGENGLIAIDETGKQISAVDFDEVHYSGLLEGVMVVVKGNKVGIIKNTGQILLPLEYEVENFNQTFNWDGDLYFEDSLYFPAKKNVKWGVVSMYGKELIPCEYDTVHAVSRNFGVVKKDEKYGVVNSNSEILIPFEFDAYLGIPAGTITLLKEDEVYLYETKSFTEINELPEITANAWAMGLEKEFEIQEMFLVWRAGKYGVINRKGKFLAPLEFERATISGKEAVVTKDGKEYYVSLNGTLTEKK